MIRIIALAAIYVAIVSTGHYIYALSAARFGEVLYAILNDVLNNMHLGKVSPI